MLSGFISLRLRGSGGGDDDDNDDNNGEGSRAATTWRVFCDAYVTTLRDGGNCAVAAHLSTSIYTLARLRRRSRKLSQASVRALVRVFKSKPKQIVS